MSFGFDAVRQLSSCDICGNQAYFDLKCSKCGNAVCTVHALNPANGLPAFEQEYDEGVVCPVCY